MTEFSPGVVYFGCAAAAPQDALDGGLHSAVFGRTTALRLGLKPPAEAATGYAKAQSQEFYQQQQRALSKHIAESDVVVTTALVPGKRAPVLIPADGEGSFAERKHVGVARAESLLADVRTRWVVADHDVHAQYPDVVARLFHDFADSVPAK